MYLCNKCLIIIIHCLVFGFRPPYGTPYCQSCFYHLSFVSFAVHTSAPHYSSSHPWNSHFPSSPPPFLTSFLFCFSSLFFFLFYSLFFSPSTLPSPLLNLIKHIYPLPLSKEFQSFVIINVNITVFSFL